MQVHRLLRKCITLAIFSKKQTGRYLLRPIELVHRMLADSTDEKIEKDDLFFPRRCGLLET